VEGSSKPVLCPRQGVKQSFENSSALEPIALLAVVSLASDSLGLRSLLHQKTKNLRWLIVHARRPV